jgi:hypothetical protein
MSEKYISSLGKQNTPKVEKTATEKQAELLNIKIKTLESAIEKSTDETQKQKLIDNLKKIKEDQTSTVKPKSKSNFAKYALSAITLLGSGVVGGKIMNNNSPVVIENAPMDHIQSVETPEHTAPTIDRATMEQQMEAQGYATPEQALVVLGFPKGLFDLFDTNHDEKLDEGEVESMTAKTIKNNFTAEEVSRMNEIKNNLTPEEIAIIQEASNPTDTSQGDGLEYYSEEEISQQTEMPVVDKPIYSIPNTVVDTPSEEIEPEVYDEAEALEGGGMQSGESEEELDAALKAMGATGNF